MSAAAAPSTVEHTGRGPSRCLACGQFAGDGHACPPRSVGADHHQALGLYATEMLGTAPSPPAADPALEQTVLLSLIHI